MNIFATDPCPAISARNLDDKRVVKMCLETAQLLCTAINFHGGTTPYKTTHLNHPCSIWARKTRCNWAWLFNHGMALCEEYTKRYGRKHKCEAIILKLWPLMNLIPQGRQTAFPNCTRNGAQGVDYRTVEDVHLAYKLYLNDRWDQDKREPTWYGVA